MADVAKPAIVSSETHNGLLMNDKIKKSPNNDPKELTEFSETNRTNSSCSKRNSCSSGPENKQGYEEIDSFSEFSFKTTDDISLQDLIESEFAARISNMNGDNLLAVDEMWPTSGTGSSGGRDPFDELFEEDGSRQIDVAENQPDAEYENDENGPEIENDFQARKMDLNADEFNCSPRKISTPISYSMEDEEEAYLEDREEFLSGSDDKICKTSRPMEFNIGSTFDPFARIEEDSDCSNPNSNVLNSPDEFPFPESPDETKEMGKIGEHLGADAEYAKGRENVADLFTKIVVSDDNLESLPGENNNEECGSLSEFHVTEDMNIVESVSDSRLTASALNSPDKNGSDLSQANGFTKAASQIFNIESNAVADELSSSEKNRVDADDLKGENKTPSDGTDLSKDDVDVELEEEEEEEEASALPKDEFETELKEDQRNADQLKHFNDVVEEEEEDWITVEDALKNHTGARNDFNKVMTNFNVNNVCSDVVVTNKDLETHDLGLQHSSINDPLNVEQVTHSQKSRISSSSENETQSESSAEKKTAKKKKSKKTKKSDEKENISVELTIGKSMVPSASLNSTAIDDCGDLANVSVKNLMRTYCSEASRRYHNGWYNKDIVQSPVPIQHLRARSMVDLTGHSNKVAVLRSNLIENFETSRSTTNLSNVERHPIVTGVSVRALKERYCSMINLNEESGSRDVTPYNKREKIRVPWSEALKSSFSKFDQLSRKTVFHVRSVDASKVQKQFNEASSVSSETSSSCKSCGKQVFQMEQIKAEKALWHKNCFRCKECGKQLTVDTYSSNEGILYCKPHFKELFKPKAVLEDDLEPVPHRKPELIIRENQPIELPPEVVRASDKPDLGLEELSSLNVKSRFQMFEKAGEETKDVLEKSQSSVNVKRSPSILSKLAKFQKKGMDIGVTDDSLNGMSQIESSTSSEEEEKEEDENSRKIIKSRKIREKPISFGKMDDVKSVWESGVKKTKEELREERKQEIQQIRSRLFLGKQVKMKEAYEQAVRESESGSPRKTIDIQNEKAKSIKECFEKGERLNLDDDEHDGTEKKKIIDDDISLIEAGISKKSRSLFLELDKSVKNQSGSPTPRSAPKTPVSPIRIHEANLSRQPSENVVKCSDAIEEVKVETAEISSKFKFFETYKEPEREKKKFRITPPREGQLKAESPEREVYRDPNVVRSSDKQEDEIIRTNTTTKMLSLFRQMEEKTEEIPDGPKPMKCLIPQLDYKDESEDESEEESEESEDEEEDIETDSNIIRSSDKVEDEYLKQAANAARAKQLRAKFEKWEEKEREREKEELRERQMNRPANNAITENSENVEMSSIECTKSLRARFESLKDETDKSKVKVSRPKVNRFVEIQNNLAETCYVCSRRVYQLEKVETSGKIFHKTCFRCMQCNCLLRMETFTLNCGRLYCLPHFKQLFITKGNYDEGFGVDQHKAKWPTVASF